MTSEGNELKSKMKQPSDMPMPRFEHGGSDLWSNTLPLGDPFIMLRIIILYFIRYVQIRISFIFCWSTLYILERTFVDMVHFSGLRMQLFRNQMIYTVCTSAIDQDMTFYMRQYHKALTCYDMCLGEVLFIILKPNLYPSNFEQVKWCFFPYCLKLYANKSHLYMC